MLSWVEHEKSFMTSGHDVPAQEEYMLKHSIAVSSTYSFQSPYISKAI